MRACMRSPGRRLSLVTAAAVVAGALLGATAPLDDVLAHCGGMASDGFHKDNKAGNRHSHADGTCEIEFIKTADGQIVRPHSAEAPSGVGAENANLLIEALKAQRADDQAEIARLGTTIANLRAELTAEKDRARGWWQRATNAEETIETSRLERDRALAHARSANADAADARERAEDARKLMEDAEARARGSGPRVDRRCRAAVEEIVHGDTGWLSDDVEVDSEGRAKLSRACLAP